LSEPRKRDDEQPVYQVDVVGYRLVVQARKSASEIAATTSEADGTGTCSIRYLYCDKRQRWEAQQTLKR